MHAANTLEESRGCARPTVDQAIDQALGSKLVTPCRRSQGQAAAQAERACDEPAAVTRKASLSLFVVTRTAAASVCLPAANSSPRPFELPAEAAKMTPKF